MFKNVVEIKDIEKIALLANKIWHEAYKEILEIKQINYMLNKFQSVEHILKEIKEKKFKYYLIYENNTEIGYFSFFEDDEIFLSKVYVLKNKRKKGYLKKVINFLKEKKKRIVLRVNKENKIAINAYLNLDFKIIEEKKTSIDSGYFMDDFIMEREFDFNDLLEIEQKRPYFKVLMDKINDEAKSNLIFPSKENWFKALELTSFSDVKVVLIGQDPYYNKNQAMGLAFGVNEGVRIPPSLVNIFKEIERSYKKPIERKGDLSSWAKQGVLLLNTIFTVSEGKPLSHKDFGWEIFTDEVLKLLQQKDFIVYLLLGNPAQKYAKKITNKNHAILKTSHPSPLSSYRGFSGSDIFLKTNELLKNNNKKKINWYLL